MMKKSLKIDEIESLCILRLSAIGDVTHVLPVIATLQKAKPSLKITWVIGKIEYKLMQGLPGVDFVVYDKNQESKALKNLKIKFKNQRFDVLFHMQYSFRANRVAWKIPAKYRIGFDKKRSRELHGLKLTHRIKAVEYQHVLDSFMEFVSVLGIKEKNYHWNVVVSEDDSTFAKKFSNPDCPMVVINPCSSIHYRDWRVENYCEVINYMQEKYNAHVIVCGSPNERELKVAEQICLQTKKACLNLAGRDTLKKLYALMQRASLVISSDSGPMHIANAAGAPVIGLHASTTARRSGAYRYHDLAIDCFSQAAKKFENKPENKIKWGHQIKHENVMDLITVQAVKEKIDVIL